MKSMFVRMWIVLVLLTVAIGAPSIVYAEAAGGHGDTAKEETKLNPIDEFALHTYGPELKIGAIDMSINKAVIYLWLSAAICCGWAVWQARKMRLKPDGKQTFTESMYEFAEGTIGKATLGSKVYSRYMPYVASLFMFIWVMNIISFLPLPFGHHSAWGFGDLSVYAASSNLNVTLALALVTFVLSHYEGVKHNGTRGYLASWVPEGEGRLFQMLRPAIWCMEALGQLLRLVSLPVRLFANMLAGHLLIGMMLGLIIIIGAVANDVTVAVVAALAALMFYLWFWANKNGRPGLAGLAMVFAVLWTTTIVLGLLFGGVPAVGLGSPVIALAFFILEVGLIASLQAFIFALLSGIYIGQAAEPAH